MSENFLDDIKNYPDGNDSMKYYYRGPFPDIERIIYQFLNGVDRDHDKKDLHAKYDAPLSFSYCIPNLRDVLTRIFNDPDVYDIRWMAYMLATTYWESASVVTTNITRPAPRKGNYTTTQTFFPIQESGKGGKKVYAYPVKVAERPNGDAAVMESHTNKLYIIPKYIMEKSKAAKSPFNRLKIFAGNKVSYKDFDGVENIYYGRGYVQLTWWRSYAEASLRLKNNFDLLTSPDLVLTREISYEIMSEGMRNGTIFANGHMLIHYFCGSYTNYIAARQIVNGCDKADNIARIARAFEKCLLHVLKPEIKDI